MSSTGAQLFNAPQFGTTVSRAQATRGADERAAGSWPGAVVRSHELHRLPHPPGTRADRGFRPPSGAPFDPTAQSLRARLLPPFWLPARDRRASFRHRLSRPRCAEPTDLWISRARSASALSVVALAGSFGVVMGLLAGYFGGRTDNVIMRAIDTQIAFPGLLLALIILATIGPHAGHRDRRSRPQWLDGLCAHDARHSDCRSGRCPSWKRPRSSDAGRAE